MSFFKITNDTISEAKARVKDTSFKEFYSSVNREMEWNTLKPFIWQADQLYLVPCLGEAFYNELCEKFKNDEIQETNTIIQDPSGLNWIAPDGQTWGMASSGELANVFKMLKTASAYYTMYHALPHLAMRVGDAGVQESNTQHAMPVRQWAMNATRKDCCFAAYTYLDKAIEKIVTEIEASNSTFDTFKTSSAYTARKSVFIDSPAAFNEYFNINSSFKAYKSLLPYIKKAERLYIDPLFGEDFVTELRTAFSAGSLSTIQTKLINKLKPYLAELSIYEGTPELNLVGTGTGWKIIENTDGIVKNAQAHQVQLEALQNKAHNNATHFKMQLEAFLYNNLDEFPTFKDSDYNKNKDDDENTTTELDCPVYGAAFL